MKSLRWPLAIESTCRSYTLACRVVPNALQLGLLGMLLSTTGCGIVFAPICYAPGVDPTKDPDPVTMPCTEEAGKRTSPLTAGVGFPPSSDDNVMNWVGTVDPDLSDVYVHIDKPGRNVNAHPTPSGRISLRGGICPSGECQLTLDGLELVVATITIPRLGKNDHIRDIQIENIGHWDGTKRADGSYAFPKARVEIRAVVNGDPHVWHAVITPVTGSIWDSYYIDRPFMTLEFQLALNKGHFTVKLHIPFHKVPLRATTAVFHDAAITPAIRAIQNIFYPGRDDDGILTANAFCRYYGYTGPKSWALHDEHTFNHITCSSPAFGSFLTPKIDGYRLDWCLFPGGQQCGEPAATALCQTHGFAHAFTWQIDENIGGKQPTKIIGTGQVCRQDLCDGFSLVQCTKPETVFFSKPVIDSYRVDWCRDWASNCGEPAATAFCQAQGYTRADTWSLAEDIGTQHPTKVISTGQICAASLCDGIEQIQCSR